MVSRLARRSAVTKHYGTGGTLTLLDGWQMAGLTGFTNGQQIASWPSMASGQALAQATSGNKPTYATSINGFNCVQFLGSSSQYMQTGSVFATPSNAISVYARVYWATLPASAQGVVSIDKTGTARNWQLRGNSSATAEAVSFVAGAGGTDAAPGSLVANTWQLLTYTNSDTDGLECWLNGTSNGSSSVRTGVSFVSGPLQVGCVGGTVPSSPLTGYVREVRVYAGRHNSTQVAAVAALM